MLAFALFLLPGSGQPARSLLFSLATSLCFTRGIIGFAAFLQQQQSKGSFRSTVSEKCGSSEHVLLHESSALQLLRSSAPSAVAGSSPLKKLWWTCSLPTQGTFSSLDCVVGLVAVVAVQLSLQCVPCEHSTKSLNTGLHFEKGGEGRWPSLQAPQEVRRAAGPWRAAKRQNQKPPLFPKGSYTGMSDASFTSRLDPWPESALPGKAPSSRRRSEGGWWAGGGGGAEWFRVSDAGVLNHMM